jgi:MFS family permease
MRQQPLPRSFWKVWTAGTFTNIGDGVSGIGLPLVATVVTRDPLLVAGVETARFLAIPLLSLTIGVWLDRLDRRRVKISADLVRILLLGLLVAGLISNTLNLVALYVIAFALGVAELFADGASSILIRRIVDKSQLEKAYGRNYTGMLLGDSFIGPPLGGWLFSLLNAIPFAFHATLLGISIWLLTTLKGEFRANSQGSTENVWQETFEGLRYLWSHRILRTLAVAAGTMGIATRVTTAIFVLFALERLHLTESQYGLIGTAFGIGGIAASTLASQISARIGKRNTLFLSLLTVGTSYILLVLTPPLIIVWLLVFVEGFAIITWGVVSTALRQAVVPDQLLGRVGGAQQFIAAGVSPLGSLLGGILARQLGLNAPFWVALILTTSAGLWLFFTISEKHISHMLTTNETRE